MKDIIFSPFYERIRATRILCQVNFPNFLRQTDDYFGGTQLILALFPFIHQPVDRPVRGLDRTLDHLFLLQQPGSSPASGALGLDWLPVIVNPTGNTRSVPWVRERQSSSPFRFAKHAAG
ncbi:MAG TPA: hypothetical protein VKF38_01625 [Anaerolineaceae bacterium]|nr:hypothetical protein [Anaerolineaceae bacterium]